ncbi:MAG: EAL domain-containing protein [Pseudomonadota bacterium]
MLGTSFAMGLTAYATGLISLWVVMVINILVGLARIIVIDRFHRRYRASAFTDAVAQRWERVFTICAVASAIVLGCWVFAACMSDDKFAMAASFAVTFGNLIGVCCRSYPFSRLVSYQLSGVFVPLLLGVELQGGLFILLGILLVPYILSILQFASDLRETQMNNITQRKLAEHTAAQLNTTVNSVPQGILLFDENVQVEIVNTAVLRYLRAPLEDVRGRPLRDILAHVLQRGQLDKNDSTMLLHWVKNPLGRAFHMTFAMYVNDKRHTVKVQSTPTSDGGLVLTCEDVTKEMESKRRLQQMERLDWLTGLLNRNYFTSLLDENLKTDPQCCVLMVHLDRFKQFNRLMGHQTGDVLLTQVTKRLERVARADGLLARHSGDKFALALFGPNALDAARMTADAMLESMVQPFFADGRQVQMGCKIGLAEAHSVDVNAAGLLTFANLALQQARKEGGADVVEFRPELAAEAIAKVELQEDLRRALERREIEAWFQPLVSLHKNQVTTCEALMRWRHPDKGLISPGIFIPMAEDMGLVSALGEWMLLEACKACATWPKTVRVAVNLSLAQFQHGDIASTVRRILHETGLEPSRLELEITESLAMDDMEGTVAVLNQFKAMGVGISMDDFGTGYSCLSHMNSLPIDKLKIDRAFVLGLTKGEKGLPLLQAISAMGRKLGLKLVVEGVEKPRELEIVTKFDLADEVQGYLFSKPLNRADIVEALRPSSTLNHRIDAQLGTKPMRVA